MKSKLKAFFLLLAWYICASVLLILFVGGSTFIATSPIWITVGFYVPRGNWLLTIEVSAVICFAAWGIIGIYLLIEETFFPLTRSSR